MPSSALTGCPSLSVIESGSAKKARKRSDGASTARSGCGTSRRLVEPAGVPQAAAACCCGTPILLAEGARRRWRYSRGRLAMVAPEALRELRGLVVADPRGHSAHRRSRSPRAARARAASSPWRARRGRSSRPPRRKRAGAACARWQAGARRPRAAGRSRNRARSGPWPLGKAAPAARRFRLSSAWFAPAPPRGGVLVGLPRPYGSRRELGHPTQSAVRACARALRARPHCGRGG